MKITEGTLPENDLRRAFVNGAKWWELHETGATMWQSDRNLAEAEAEKRYPDGQDAELAATRAALDAARLSLYGALTFYETAASHLIDDEYERVLVEPTRAALTRLDATRGEAG